MYAGNPAENPDRVANVFVFPAVAFPKLVEIPLELTGRGSELVDSIPSVIELQNAESEFREVLIYDMKISSHTVSQGSVSDEQDPQVALPSPAPLKGNKEMLGAGQGTTTPVPIPEEAGETVEDVQDIFEGIFGGFVENKGPKSPTLPAADEPSAPDISIDEEKDGLFSGIFGGFTDDESPIFPPPAVSADTPSVPDTHNVTTDFDSSEKDQDDKSVEISEPNAMAIVGATPSIWIEKCPFDCQFIFSDLVT